MRLLFLTPQLPYPPHKGTAIRNYNLIAGLAQRHEIDLLTFADAPPGKASPLSSRCRRVETLSAPVRSLTRRALATLLSPLPDMALRLWQPRFAKRLGAWLAERNYHVIQIEGIEMARYGLLARNWAGRARLVFDDHNAEWLLQWRAYQAERQLGGWSAGAIYSLIQTWKLKRFERAVCRAVDRIVAVSTLDADAIRRLDPALRVAVVTNGVDTQHYRPGVVAPFEFGAPAIVFTGTMDFRPNVDAALWFVARAWPQVRAAIPSAQFWIVGQRPHARLDALRGRDDVRITGGVEDVRPYLLGASACAIPLRMGGGTRLKVLEAMALGAPIVTTSLGIDGFDVAHEREVVIADDPDRFAGEIVRLVGDAGRRRALGERGRQFVVARYDWRDIVPEMEAVYE